MARAKTQKNEPSLFDVFDYYDEKGELQNDVLSPDNRFREQGTDRELLQGQRETSGAFKHSQGELPSHTRGAGSISQASTRGGIRGLWEYEHTRGDMGERSEQTREKTATDSSQSTNGVLFRPQDMDNHRERLAAYNGISQSARVGDTRFSNSEGLSSSMDNSYSSAMGKTSLSTDNSSSGLRQADLSHRETARGGDRSLYASLTSAEHSGFNTLSSSSDNGSKPQSILPSVAGTKEQILGQSQQYMGDSSERTQGESSRGDLLENQSSLNETSMRGHLATQQTLTTQIPQSPKIPDFTLQRQNGEVQSLIDSEQYLPVGENYKLGEDITIKGLRNRFEANIAAISTLRDLQSRSEAPNEEQKRF